MKNKYIFDSVIIDYETNSFQILNGTEGTYSIADVSKCTILNEKASKKGTQKPFLALMPGKGLPTGIFSTPYLFVGIEVILVNDEQLAIYISKEKTQVGTNQYEKDREEAKKILKHLKNKK